MKYSTLSFIISSSILLHACGSSNDIQNHTTDPNPNQNSQHQSNSHNINGNQSSNNSNQAANQSQNSNHSPKTNNQNDFTPNISSGNAPKPKNNIIISANNHDNDNDAPIPAPPKINLDTLTKDQADQLVKKAGDKLQKTTIEKNAADQALKLTTAQQSTAKKLFDAAAEAVKKAKDSTSLAIAKQQLKSAQETLDTAEKNLAIEKVKAKKAEEAFAMASLEKGLADNAKKFVSDKTTEPAAVLDKIKAEQDAKQAIAEKKELEIKKSLLSEEAKAADDQAKALGKQNEKLKEITADNSATPEAKKEAETKIKENEDKITKLNKQNKEKTQAAKDLDVPIKQANVVVNSENNKVKDAVKAAAYRGVYASDGKYDASTSYKNLSKVTYNENDAAFEFHLNGSDKPLKFKVNQLNKDLKSADQKTSYGKFATIDGKNILIKEMWKPQNSKRNNIYGVIDGNYFSVGEVTPEAIATADKIGKVDIIYNKGGAFLKTPQGKTLVAKVTATANFDKKELSGDFEGFKAYTTETSVSNDKYVKEGFDKLSKVHFDAKIDGNKFVPLETPKKPDDAKVYGYFYGTGAKEAGGLVEHDKFNGSFGLE